MLFLENTKFSFLFLVREPEFVVFRFQLLNAVCCVLFFKVVHFIANTSTCDFLVDNYDIVCRGKYLCLDGQIPCLLEFIVIKFKRTTFLIFERSITQPIFKVRKGFSLEYVVAVKNSSWGIYFGQAEQFYVVFVDDALVDLRIF